jgi:hypothetical protein
MDETDGALGSFTEVLAQRTPPGIDDSGFPQTMSEVERWHGWWESPDVRRSPAS